VHFVTILEAFAGLEAEQAKFDRAERLIGASEALNARIRGVRAAPQADRHRRWSAGALRALGEERGAAERAAGRAMPLDEALAYALGRTARPSDGETPAAEAGPLTRRQWEVARLVARGRSNREIALDLVISERTAERHVEDILNRLGLG